MVSAPFCTRTGDVPDDEVTPSLKLITAARARSAPRAAPAGGRSADAAPARRIGTFFLDGSNIDEGIVHNFVIGSELREPIVQSDFMEPGDTLLFTVSGLTPGTYTLWCSVDEHYAIGMVGTLEVES
jgi:hypothetical protein